MNQIQTTIHKAKTHLSKYLAMLERQEIDELLILRRDQPVARLLPPAPLKPKKLIFGAFKHLYDGRDSKAELDLTAAATQEAVEESIDKFMKDVERPAGSE